MYLLNICNRTPKIKTKNIKNYNSVLAIVNHRNWLDDSPPLMIESYWISVRVPNWHCVVVHLESITPNFQWGLAKYSLYPFWNDLQTNPKRRLRLGVVRLGQSASFKPTNELINWIAGTSARD